MARTNTTLPKDDDHSPEAWTTRQTVLGGHLSNMYSTLQVSTGPRTGTPPQNKRLGKTLGQATRAAADVMDLVPEVFTGTPFTSSILRAEEERLRGITSGEAAVQKTLTNIGTEITWSEGTLAERVGMVIDTTEALLKNPLTPEDVKKKLESAAQPLLTILTERNTTKATRRAATMTTSAKESDADAEKTRLTLTNKFLAGETLRPEDVMASQPLPARAGRRRQTRGRPKNDG